MLLEAIDDPRRRSRFNVEISDFSFWTCGGPCVLLRTLRPIPIRIPIPIPMTSPLTF